jgi:hypothetical protein
VEYNVKEIINQFNEKGVKTECPFCGGNDLEINPLLTTPIISEGIGVATLDTKGIIPTFQVYCKTCGYVANFAKLKK